MTAPIPLLPEITALSKAPPDLLGECERQPFQASGPGGQKRNRTYSAIRLVHPSGVRAECAEFREAARNQERALHRLRRAFALALATRELKNFRAAPDPAGAFLSTLDWPAFRYPVREDHPDRPNLIALALVLLRLYNGQPAPAADRLGASTSAFVKFCKSDGDLWRFTQELRNRNNLPPLR